METFTIVMRAFTYDGRRGPSVGVTLSTELEAFTWAPRMDAIYFYVEVVRNPETHMLEVV